MISFLFFFFFQAEDGIRDVAVTGVQTCALPIYPPGAQTQRARPAASPPPARAPDIRRISARSRHSPPRPLPPSPSHPLPRAVRAAIRDRKSTRLNSSHGYISYAVFCLKKKNI